MQASAQLLPQEQVKDQNSESNMLNVLPRVPKMVAGMHQRFIRWLMWMNILLVSIRKFRSPLLAIKKTKQLRKLRDQYRNQHLPLKYSYVGNKYFVNYNTPAWPSQAFNHYVSHLLNRAVPGKETSLNTLVFAITKKCGFRCEHCCEWENLNKPEKLSKHQLLSIVRRFQQLGVSQIQLSGGEPLNRFDDILFILDNAAWGTDFWLYTTGFQLTAEKARVLRGHGLRGVTISLDHHDPEFHDAFRGRKSAYHRALQAARFVVDAKLALCFSLCATRQFISPENLMKYAELAMNAGASFIQILEPKAVGHYAGQDVTLKDHHQKILEQFSEQMNYDKTCSSYPIVTYHGDYSRRIGCSGSGKDYLYVDTDGDVHNCPFCQRKLFSALDESLEESVCAMKLKGCGAFSNCSVH
jgi:MoaA/NifB/PqqE/SkfB family radical SAM enzyme